MKEATRNAISKVTANGGAPVTPVTSANASPITARAATAGADQTDNLLEPPGGKIFTLIWIFFVIHISSAYPLVN